MKPLSQSIILTILSFVFIMIAIIFSIWDGEEHVPLLSGFSSIVALLSTYISYENLQKKGQI